MKTVTLIELDDGELGFEIPKEIIEELSITDSTTVSMEINEDNGSLIIRFRN